MAGDETEKVVEQVVEQEEELNNQSRKGSESQNLGDKKPKQTPTLQDESNIVGGAMVLGGLILGIGGLGGGIALVATNILPGGMLGVFFIGGIIIGGIIAGVAIGAGVGGVIESFASKSSNQMPSIPIELTRRDSAPSSELQAIKAATVTKEQHSSPTLRQSASNQETSRETNDRLPSP